MTLPRKLKAINLFNDANSYQGIVTAVTLPKLARKLDPYRSNPPHPQRGSQQISWWQN